MSLRLFFAFLLVVLVTAISVVALTSQRLRADIGQFINRGGLSGNEQLVEALETLHQRQGSWVGARAVMLQHHRPGGGLITMLPIALADVDGTVLVTIGMGANTPGGGFGPGETGQQSGAAPPPASLAPDDLTGAIPLYDRGAIVGYLLPQNRMAIPPGIEAGLLARLNRSALVAAGLAAALSLPLALLLSYVLLGPVRDLTRAAHAMAGGDLNQRVVPSGGRETTLLAETFNRMAGSLQDAEARRKALTADIAHELRNPLAVQRANLEALQDGVYPLTKENLAPVLRQNQLLESLVEDLRMLALADSGQLRLEIAPTDLPALVRHHLADMEAEAAARGVDVCQMLPDMCPPVPVDPGRIGQILANLIGNALTHTPAGGRIEVSLRCDPGRTVLTVRDTGPGIAAQDLPNIFERFYRGDQARERTFGSTGLGLSIARRLAEAHRGSLEAANHPEGGAVFTLTLATGG